MGGNVGIAGDVEEEGTETSWAGRVVIVTGSSSGIGEQVAREFARRGASVLVNSAHSVETGQAVASSLPDARYLQADISDEEQAQRLVTTAVDSWGRLDVLVNNAGVTKLIPHADLQAATLDVWREIFAVNVFGTWAVTVAAVEALSEHRGCVVNVSSLAGLRALGSSIPYAASKAALNHLTVLLAKVLGPQVRVNAVAPGLIDTPWTESWEDSRRGVRSVAPMRRSGVPADVADAVLYLAGATYVTGEVIAVDGGFGKVM
jgi:ketoreductase RED2